MSLTLRRVSLPQRVRLPTTPGPLAGPEVLAHPTPAHGSPFELSARRVRVIYSGSGGVELLEADGQALLARVAMAGAVGANLLVGPRTARRECFVQGASLVETLQLPEALPGVALQWLPAPSPEGTSIPLRISAELFPEADSGEGGAGSDTIRVHSDSGILWVARGDRGILLHAPGCSSVPALHARDGRIILSWEPVGIPEGDPVTLLVQAAPPEASWSSLTALAGTVAHHRRGEAAAWGDDEPGVTLASGVQEIDCGLRWSRSWIRHRLRSTPGRPADTHPLPELGRGLRTESAPPLVQLMEELEWAGSSAAAAWFVMGSAASGDWEAGRAALGGIGGHGHALTPLAALALARWTAWTGEGGPLRECLPGLLALFEDPSNPGALAEPVRRGIQNVVASAAEAAELPELVRAARDGWATAQAGSAPAPPGRQLPMVDADFAGPSPHVMPGRNGIPVPDRLQEALAVREGLGAVARAPVAGTLSGSPLLALALVEGVMGAIPDATFGRVTLSPLLPPNWTRLTVSGIRCGEGALGVSYERDGGLVRWTLRPELGSVPLMTVFEPWQPLVGVRAVTVDGAPAELDRVSEGGWTRIAVQIPVDGVRVVEVEGEAPSLP